MTSSPSGHPFPSLSLLVLLPSSAHVQQNPTPIAPLTRPPPLTSRLSGSTVPSLKSIYASSQQGRRTDVPEEPFDDVVDAGRRLSLAPGIGAGTQSQMDMYMSLLSAPSASSSPTSSSRSALPSAASPTRQTSETPEASSSTAPAFGSKRHASGRSTSGRRRPATAAGAQEAGSLFGPHRASTQTPMGLSISAAGGGGGGGGVGRTRPGWEGDQIVGVLRASGMEVTVIRHTSHLPSILSPPDSATPTYASFSQHTLAAARSLTPSADPSHVILVPLCDSLSLPSLSLLLAEGTTPTAVCFQQDVLERAKRTEEDWLPSALDHIARVSEMRERATHSLQKGSERPVVLAYSANPALSPATISACVSAGASGVLKPPYDFSTAELVIRMVQAAREGRLSSIVELPSSRPNPLPTPQSIFTSLRDGSSQVVLPPTALSSGAEHEAEKVLSAAVGSHRLAKSGSGQLTPRAQSPVITRSRESSIATLYPRKASLRANHLYPPQAGSPTSLLTGSDGFPDADLHLPMVTGMYWYHPSYTNRRRSVDVAGLAMALRRTERAFLKTQHRRTPRGVLTATVKQGYMFPGTPPSSAATAEYTEHAASQQCEDESRDTQLAELLSAMYYQTQLAINVQMSDFAALSAALSIDERHRLVDALATWDFKPHHLDQADLFRAAGVMFEGILTSEGLRELNIGRDQMNRLLFAIRAIYHAPNPYHNYVHAIDVLQATYSFLIGIGIVPSWSYLHDLDDAASAPAWQRPDEVAQPVWGYGTRRARDVLRPQDALAVMIAAMGHDVGHPGLSNAFMKNAKTPLSQVYEDKSVLENMHCMLMVQLLRKHGFGFLFATSPLERNRARAALDTRGFRKVLYSSVLATDMSLHFAWIAELKQLSETLSKQPEVDEGEDRREADRIMICQALIKCADISNPTRPIDVSEHWSSVLLKEWAMQASLEQDLDLPVSVIGSADAALQAKGQIGFIDLFTQPLFEAVSDVLPELQCYADWCAANRQLWQSRLDTFMADAADGQSSSTLIQPSVDGAAQDERFRTLFPLLLPPPLVDLAALEPGPTVPTASAPPPDMPRLEQGSQWGWIPPSTHATHPHTGAQAPEPTQMRTQAQTQTPTQTPTPTQAQSSTPGHTPTPGRTHTHMHTCSPASKAMRAVYHANLLDQRARLSSWNTRVRIPGLSAADGLLEIRRSSMPAVV